MLRSTVVVNRLVDPIVKERIAMMLAEVAWGLRIFLCVMPKPTVS